MKPITLVWLLCSLVIVAAAFLMAVAYAESVVNYIVAGLILVTLIIFIFYKRSRKYPKPDERDIKIARAANSYSWFLSYTMIALLMLVEILDIMELSVFGVLMITMFFMLFSRLFTRALLMRMGDVN